MKELKRLLAIVIVILMAMGGSLSAYALTTQEKIDQAEQEKEDTENKLSDTKDDISGLQGEQSSLQGTLDNLNEQLTDVGNTLTDLESQISDKEDEIEQTQTELDQAQQTADDQYAAMKIRIQYMYENSDFEMLDVLLNSKSFSDMLNYIDYVEAMSEYDREMLQQYEAVRDQISEKEDELQDEKDDLSDAKVEQEAEQSRVSGLVSTASNGVAEYADQISEAESEAEAYEAQIEDQESNIADLKEQLAKEIAMSQLAAQSAKRDISQVTFADGDRYLLANLIYCEAGGEPYAGQVAVGAVVMNRLLSSVYPDTITGVIYQSNQFAPVASGRLAIALSVDKATSSCYQAADEAMSGVSNVGDCVYFRTPIDGLNGISIGGHIFY